MSTEPTQAETTPARDPWWTAAVPGLVVLVGAALGLTLGVALGAAPGAIFLGGSVLVGAILLFWSSVRLLLGEKLPGIDLSDEIAGTRLDDPLHEKKRAALAALQDMERERELGRITDADYDEVVQPLREQAKTILKELDARAAPFREQAERLAAAHLAKVGLGKDETKAKDETKVAENTEAPAPTDQANERAAEPERRACAACQTDNEADAKFCKSCGKILEIADAS